MTEKVSSFRVGYVPYSLDLQHPADRRRLAVWAASKNMQLNLTNPLDSDVLVLSGASNFGYWQERAKQPVILDLVDGYLGENPSFVRDLVRNIVRTIRGTSNFHWITYTRHLRKACQLSDAVIVASPEQRDLILNLNNNVFVILDDHSEFEKVLSSAFDDRKSAINLPQLPHIMWEGFGFTIKHFRFIAKELDQFLHDYKWGLYLITVSEFPRWGGYIGRVKTRELIRKMFPLSWQAIEIIPWSVENLVNYARISDLGIIPIDPEDKFATFKPENKLLSMWHLHLPVIFSDIPSYLRVARAAEVESAVVESDSWGQILQEISAKPAILNKLSDKGFEFVNKNHTREILVEKWSNVLSTTIKRNQ